MAVVVVIEGPDDERQEYRLAEGETPIGRDPANALLLDGRGVSRRHAKFILTGDRLVIADLGSTYGTRVNDVTTLRRDLVLGDEITVGMYRLTIKVLTDALTGAASDSDGSPWESDFHSDEVTQSPDDMLQMKTQEMSRSTIQFIMDNPEAKDEGVPVLPRHDSDLYSAMQRIGSVNSGSMPTLRRPSAPSADYTALVLMFKASELLAAATDLDGFVGPMADLVLDEVKADSVVLFMLDKADELVPQVIRYRGSLNVGEVPVSRAIVDRVVREKVPIMCNDLGHDENIKAGNSIMLYQISAVVAFPLMVKENLKGVLYIGRSGGDPFSSEDHDLMAAMVSLISSGIQKAELKDVLVREKQQRLALERFHPAEVVDRLFKKRAGEISLEEHRATALVCDLRGFQGLVQRVPPRQLATLLHEYYEMLYEKVFANGGSLVKLHDGWAVALFGAPQSHDRDSVWAVETAINLYDEYLSLSVLWPESQRLHLCLALDTGDVVAGVVGSTERIEYAAIGLPISTASALVQRAEESVILVSERTYAELPPGRHHTTEVDPLGDLRVFSIQRKKGGR